MERRFEGTTWDFHSSSHFFFLLLEWFLLSQAKLAEYVRVRRGTSGRHSQTTLHTFVSNYKSIKKYKVPLTLYVHLNTVWGVLIKKCISFFITVISSKYHKCPQGLPVETIINEEKKVYPVYTERRCRPFYTFNLLSSYIFAHDRAFTWKNMAVNREQEWFILNKRGGKKEFSQRCVMTSASSCRRDKKNLLWLKLCLSTAWSTDRKGYSNSYKTYLNAKGSSHPTGSIYLPSSVPRWHQPRGRRATRSVSEEGHPLGVVLGTNAAATFPLLYPSAGFGWLLQTTAQIWPHFNKHACTVARPLYKSLFFKYCQEQLNRRMEPFIPPPPMLENSTV